MNDTRKFRWIVPLIALASLLGGQTAAADVSQTGTLLRRHHIRRRPAATARQPDARHGADRCLRGLNAITKRYPPDRVTRMPRSMRRSLQQSRQRTARCCRAWFPRSRPRSTKPTEARSPGDRWPGEDGWDRRRRTGHRGCSRVAGDDGAERPNGTGRHTAGVYVPTTIPPLRSGAAQAMGDDLVRPISTWAASRACGCAMGVTITRSRRSAQKTVRREPGTD